MEYRTLGLVIPVYSGEKYLASLVEQIEILHNNLRQADAPLRLSQVLLVLDEPIDDSASVALKLADVHPWLDVLTLSRGFGQHPATVAGVLHTSTDWVATLDEDLQHPPSLLPDMVARAAIANADLVYACNPTGTHKSWRDTTSRLAKHLVALIAGVEHAIDFSSFRLVRGSIARAAASVAGHETYFDVALTWHTTRVERYEAVLIDQRSSSGYRFRSLISHFRRLVISSNATILRAVAGLGLVGVLASMLGFGWLLAGSVLGFRAEVQGWLSTMMAVLFFGGILTLAMSFLSEYVLNIAQRVQGRPTFHTVDRSSDLDLLPWANRTVANDPV